MKVAVLGAGAIGAYVGASVRSRRPEVHLIARGAAPEGDAAHGVRVFSATGRLLDAPPGDRGRSD